MLIKKRRKEDGEMSCWSYEGPNAFTAKILKLVFEKIFH